MSRISYEQARADHEYLWRTYGPANDMTGGYVDTGDLVKLLKSPTKATARDCLCSQIAHWFSVGPEPGAAPVDPTDERLLEIADRHGVSIL
jgi:hypothetical protein